MRETRLEMKIESKQGRYSRSWAVGALAGARYVGRDMTAVRCTLDAQLAHDGFYTSATRTNPSIFRIGRYLLTQDTEFEVQGPLTGGEAEVVAIRDGGEIFIAARSLLVLAAINATAKSPRFFPTSPNRCVRTRSQRWLGPTPR